MTLAELLLRDGIPPSLLIDLYDLEGMFVALAAELLPADVAGSPPPSVRTDTHRLRSA
ncbi:MAG TPA: hypothetical protein VM097_01395 [Mycobacteriales bacterium]|nr:hypothetical protein [Mycobacteriales bacterium]